MKTWRLRWILPLYHLIIDLVLVGALFYAGRRIATGDRNANFKNASDLQEGGTEVRFDRRHMWDDYPPVPFQMIVLGTLPASIIAGLVFPDAGYQTLPKWLDLKWSATHEILALAFWAIVGWLVVLRSPKFRKLAIAYIGLRAVTLAALPGSQVGPRILGLFWAPLVIWSLIAAIIWLVRFAFIRVHSRPI